MNEVDAIFNAISKASNFVHINDQISKKNAQIRNVKSKRCGNCDHWMKSSCLPEKKHKQFKSCDSFACKDFSVCWHSNMLAKQFEEELTVLKSRLKST